MARTRVVWMALLSCCLTAGIASAQPPDLSQLGMVGANKPRSWHVGVGGGMTVPAGDLDSALDNAIHGHAWFSWQPPLIPYGLRATFGYDRFDLKGTQPGVPNPDDTASMLSGLANLTIGFPMGPVRPYLLAGVGAFQFDSKSSADEDVQFGINGGAGLEIRFGAIAAFIEGRVDNVFTDKGFNTDLQNNEKLKALMIPVTFGISY